MKRQSKRPTSSHESTPEPASSGQPLEILHHRADEAWRHGHTAGDRLAFPYPEEENLLITARNMEHEEIEMDDVDDHDEEVELAGGPSAARSSCGLGENKRRLAPAQVRALERCFETDNKLDPDRKVRIARDLGLQPRQVAVWFQNRRARSKTKQLERDFAALRARHDALRADRDALRRDKDALAAEIRELRHKLYEPETTVKAEAACTEAAAEDRQATVDGASATATTYKDGCSDSDSSAVFNDVGASPYSAAAVLEPPPPHPAGGFVGFGGSFMDSLAATMMAGSSLPSSGTKWQLCDSYKQGGSGYDFTEEWLAGPDVIGNDGAAGFFSDEHVSGINTSWYASGSEAWE